MRLPQFLPFLFIIIPSICGVLDDDTLKDLRQSVENLTSGHENQSTHCYYSEEAPICYGLIKGFEMEISSELTEAAEIKFRDYFFYQRNSRTLCMQRPPLNIIEYEEAVIDIIQLRVSVTLVRKWLQEPVTLTMDCLFLDESGKKGKQQCCTSLKDKIYSSSETTMSYQGRFIFPLIQTELRFEDEEIILDDLPETNFSEMKEGEMNKESKAIIAHLFEVPETPKTSLLQNTGNYLREHGLKSILPPLLIIGLFVALLCTRKLWGPLLLEKMPKLDKWLHSNRLETKSQKSVDSDDSWELVQSEDLNLFRDFVMLQPGDPEEAEEAIEAEENGDNGAGIENFEDNRVNPAQLVDNGLNMTVNVETDVPQQQRNENDQIIENDSIRAPHIEYGQHTVDVEIEAIQLQGGDNGSHIVVRRQEDSYDESDDAHENQVEENAEEVNIGFASLVSGGVNLQDLLYEEDEV